MPVAVTLTDAELNVLCTLAELHLPRGHRLTQRLDEAWQAARATHDDQREGDDAAHPHHEAELLG